MPWPCWASPWTESHIRILKRFVDRIMLVLDGDEAGQKRTNEVLELSWPSRSICAYSRCPTIWTLATSSGSAAARHLPNFWQRARSMPWTMPFARPRGGWIWIAMCMGRARPWSGCWRSWRRPRDSGPIRPRDRLREEKFLQRFAALFRVNETEVRRRMTALRRNVRAAGSGPTLAAGGTPAQGGGRLPPSQPGGRARCSIAASASSWSCWWSMRRPGRRPARRLPRTNHVGRAAADFETGCRLLQVGVLPDFDRLILEFDNPSLKSLLVDLDEQGRAKGSRLAAPDELLSDLVKAFQQKEVEKQRPAQLVALRNKPWPTTRRLTCSRASCSRREAGKAFPIPRTGDDALARAIPCLEGRKGEREIATRRKGEPERRVFLSALIPDVPLSLSSPAAPARSSKP